LEELVEVEGSEESEQPIIRRVWQTGKGAKTGKGSFVTALPTKWARGLTRKEVTISVFKDRLVIMPRELKRHKIGHLKYRGKDSNFLKYQIISAYLNNFRELFIELDQPSKECIQMIESLPKKLLGLSPAFVEGDRKRMISMSTFLKPIPEILDQMLALIQGMHKINQETMLKFNLSEDQLENMKAMENDVDRNSFLIKRFCCVAADEPNLARRVGIDDLAKITHWETLNSNLERVGDLQFEICLELNRFEKHDKKEAMNEMRSDKVGYNFMDYHNSAQKMVNDAYSNDPMKITEIINTKRSESEDEIIKHRGKYITKEQGKAIRDAVNRIPDLTCLDFRIWGLTGCATNIAEAWLNMNGPLNADSNKWRAKNRPL
jgi:hypothetical protein